MDAFHKTLRQCERMGLDLRQVPSAALRIFFNAGAAFHEEAIWTPAERREFRESILGWHRETRGDRGPEAEARRLDREVLKMERAGPHRSEWGEWFSMKEREI